MTEPPGLSDDPAPWMGRRVGKYEIVRPIGQGGMGSVFEAVHAGIGKRVAMKFVTRSMASHRDAVARFEARAASAVESAHIVQIFDTGEDDEGRPFIVMELLRGESLGARARGR